MRSSLLFMFLFLVLTSFSIDSKAQEAQQEVATAQEEQEVDEIITQISAAIEAGDSKLVTSLLAKAVKANPKIAAKIVSAFVAKIETVKNSAGGATSQAAKKAAAAAAKVDVAAVVSRVAKSLQNVAGTEAVAAAVLGAYAPAAAAAADGDAAVVSQPQEVAAVEQPAAPPPPPLSFVGGGGSPAQVNIENPNQDTSSPN